MHARMQESMLLPVQSNLHTPAHLLTCLMCYVSTRKTDKTNTYARTQTLACAGDGTVARWKRKPLPTARSILTMSLRSLSEYKVTQVPVRPARPVRPAHWTVEKILMCERCAHCADRLAVFMCVKVHEDQNRMHMKHEKLNDDDVEQGGGCTNHAGVTMHGGVHDVTMHPHRGVLFLSKGCHSLLLLVPSL